MAKKKHIVILATGGTIAGVGEPGKNTGYVSGQISAADLVASVPELSEYAEITAEQICNVNSDDMTDKLWIKLSNRIADLQTDDSVDGIVVTHGTDTMDETAYFVSLTVKCEKAVIFTGSMKPATATTILRRTWCGCISQANFSTPGAFKSALPRRLTRWA